METVEKKCVDCVHWNKYIHYDNGLCENAEAFTVERQLLKLHAKKPEVQTWPYDTCNRFHALTSLTEQQQ